MRVALDIDGWLKVIEVPDPIGESNYVEINMTPSMKLIVPKKFQNPKKLKFTHTGKHTFMGTKLFEADI
jgi:hypothetical protein